MASQRLFIDLFAGCGGLSLGLRQAGWSSLFAVEAHPHAFETYKKNHLHVLGDWPSWLPATPHRVEGLMTDHRRELANLAGSVSLVAGGPPCQGFSTAGRRQPGDPRNAMVRHYLDFLKLVQPELVLLENVRGFTTMQHEGRNTYSDFVCEQLEGIGYQVWSQMLIASDWGVPQRRPRFFVIASRQKVRGVDPFLRLRVARSDFLKSRELPIDREVSVAEAIDDLRTTGKPLVQCIDGGVSGFHQIAYGQPRDPQGYLKLMRRGAAGAPNGLRLPRHSLATQNRFEEVQRTCTPGRPLSIDDRNRLKSLKRSFTPLAASLPSCTVTTLPDDILHYAEPRILTVRECARLQSFPDSFELCGPYTTGGPQRRNACPRYTQIGNAVPPLLAEAIGEMLSGLLNVVPKLRLKRGEVVEVST